MRIVFIREVQADRAKGGYLSDAKGNYSTGMDEQRLGEANCTSSTTAARDTKTITTASHDESQSGSVEPASRKVPTSVPSRAK